MLLVANAAFRLHSKIKLSVAVGAQFESKFVVPVLKFNVIVVGLTVSGFIALLKVILILLMVKGLTKLP